MEISPRQVSEQDTARIIDVRSKTEFHSKRIPNSYNIPLEEMKTHLSALKSMKQEVVLVSRVGVQAARAQSLIGRPASKVKVLTGGLNAWEKDGHPVVYSGGIWDLSRQVRVATGIILAVATYLGTYVNAWYMAVVGVISLGIILAGLFDSRAVHNVFSKMPWNLRPEHDTETVLKELLEQE